MRNRWILLVALCAGLMLVRWWWFAHAKTAEHPSVGAAATEVASLRLPSESFDRRAMTDAGLTHVDAQKRAEMLQRLLALLKTDAMRAPEPNDPPNPIGVGGQRRLRSTNDIETAARFIQERIRNDFVPMARGCYADLLRRKPEAEGDVVVGFEVLGDESVGGVVNSAEIRDESTLRDESLETCLRESFLSVYFDPPPGGAAATIRFPFHFANGDVDGSHELHLRDRRGEGAAPSAPR